VFPTGIGATRSALMAVNTSRPDGGCGAGAGDDADPPGEIANGMLPLARSLSYLSAVLSALRTQTPTRDPEATLPGVQVHELLVDQLVITIQLPPSYVHHLY
jgi:hypothetical protein